MNTPYRETTVNLHSERSFQEVADHADIPYDESHPYVRRAQQICDQNNEIPSDCELSFIGLYRRFRNRIPVWTIAKDASKHVDWVSKLYTRRMKRLFGHLNYHEYCDYRPYRASDGEFEGHPALEFIACQAQRAGLDVAPVRSKRGRGLARCVIEVNGKIWRVSHLTKIVVRDGHPYPRMYAKPCVQALSECAGEIIYANAEGYPGELYVIPREYLEEHSTVTENGLRYLILIALISKDNGHELIDKAKFCNAWHYAR